MPSVRDSTLVSQFQPEADGRQKLGEPGEVAVQAGNLQDQKVWEQQMGG